MINWRRLFGEAKRPSLGIEGDFPPEMTQRARRPRRSKGMTAEERAAEEQRYIEERRRIASVTSASNRQRAIEAGITRYRWSSCLDNRTCERCRRNEGKIFSHLNAPKGGVVSHSVV
nr:phage minor head protein [Bradyrhizobium sp. CCH5-A9]